MIHVIAIITAKPGKREEVLAAFRANMPAVHAEQGCIEYGPATDAEGGPGAKWRRYLCRHREMGEPRSSEGACRLATYAGLRREDARPPRQSRGSTSSPPPHSTGVYWYP